MQTSMMVLETDAISPEGIFDPRYTCDLDNSSPELRWSNPPEEVAQFAVVAQDLELPPAASILWLIYNIPSHIHHLPAGIPPQEALPNGILQGINSLGKLGYSGPCPPLGDRPHQYVLKLFALKAHSDYGKRLNYSQLFEIIHPLIINVAEVTARYQRMYQRAG